ncbi:uncharacterized protein LOC131885089 [Tigriopus californicus]|nr:uncharacterized protein LOC131885089 [Tigriopus californicus]
MKYFLVLFVCVAAAKPQFGYVGSLSGVPYGYATHGLNRYAAAHDYGYTGYVGPQADAHNVNAQAAPFGVKRIPVGSSSFDSIALQYAGVHGYLNNGPMAHSNVGFVPVDEPAVQAAKAEQVTSKALA